MEEARAKKIDIDSNDKISLLPEAILHHILCFLNQKEAIQTCVLSKSWRYLGCTRPKIEFLGSRNVYYPSAVLDSLLQDYDDRNLCLDEFTIWMSDGDRFRDPPTSLLNKWIPIIIQNMRVTTFHLSLKSRQQYFELPLLILESYNIQNLSLVGCVLRSTAPVRIHLKRLQTLSLDDVYIPEEILNSILSNCPFLENVTLKRIKTSSNNNKDGDVSIEIGDHFKTLKTIEIKGCLFSVTRIKPFEFARLKRLKLTRVKLSRSGLFPCNLHCLEEMKLKHCSGIEELKLSSRSMKRLSISNIRRPFKATIDAPSIVRFNYEGILPQSISFATTPSEDHLWESKIDLQSLSPYDYGDDDDEQLSHCFNELYGLLKALGQSKICLSTLDQFQIRRFGSQLHIGDDSGTNIDFNIVGVSEGKQQLPVVMETLRIMSSVGNMSAAAFLNKLFHMFRPNFMYMGWGMLMDSDNKHSREIVDILFKERETAQSYFWQHLLEGVGLQVKYRNQREWQPVEHASFTDLRIKGADGELELRIQMKWKD